MNLSDVEMLPYPNAVFYLTGASVITLLYVTFYSTINKIPEVIGEQVTSVSNSVSSFGDSVSKTASNMYSNIPSVTGSNGAPGPAPAPAPAQAQVPIPAPMPVTQPVSAGPGIISNISDSLSKLNPFAAQGQPVKGGSRKKHKKRTKKTRRSKK